MLEKIHDVPYDSPRFGRRNALTLATCGAQVVVAEQVGDVTCQECLDRLASIERGFSDDGTDDDDGCIYCGCARMPGSDYCSPFCAALAANE